MATVAFDTHKFVRTLLDSGFEERLAEGQMEGIKGILEDLEYPCLTIDSQKYYRKLMEAGMGERQAEGLAEATYNALEECCQNVPKR